MRNKYFSRLCFILATAGLLVLAAAGYSREIDSHRILAIRVSFPVESPDNETTTGTGMFDLQDFENTPGLADEYEHPYDIPPHNKEYFNNHFIALSRYIQTISDSLTLISDWDIFPEFSDEGYTMPRPLLKYGNGRTTEDINRKIMELFRDALAAADSVDGASIDFSAYDLIILFHAGVGKETSQMLNDIPSAYLTTEDFRDYLDSPIILDGKAIREGIILPEALSDFGNGGLNGLLAQFFAQHLGLPILSNTVEGMTSIGEWGLMDYGAMAWGDGTRGFIPTHPIMWSKITLGWVEPLIVMHDTLVTISATHIKSGFSRAVKIPLNQDEYLLLENRIAYADRDSIETISWITFSDSVKKQGVWLAVPHYDDFLPGSGILVWHINERLIRENPNRINGDMYARGIKLIEADGYQDIGTLYSIFSQRIEYVLGHEDDPFYEGAYITPYTNPSTATYYDAFTGVSLMVPSSPGDTMSVRITFEKNSQGWPVRFPGETFGTAGLNSGDLNGDGKPEYILVSKSGNLRILDENARMWSYEQGGEIAVISNYFDQYPVIVDANSDGNDEVYIVNGTGSIFAAVSIGDSVFQLRTVKELGANVSCMPLAGDIDTGLPGPELAVGHENGKITILNLLTEQTDTVDQGKKSPVTGIACLLMGIVVSYADGDVYFYSLDGESTGFSTGSDSILTPVILNTDHENSPETAVLSKNGKLTVRSIISGGDEWEIIIDEANPLPSAAGDLNSDGYPELIAAGPRNIRAFSTSGIELTDFMTLSRWDTEETFTSPPIIADVSGNGHPDVIIGSSTGNLYSFDHQGNPVHGFPIALYGPLSSACLVRSSDDGTNTVIFAATDSGVVYLLDLDIPWSPSAAMWPSFHCDRGGTSSLPDSLLVPVEAAKENFFVYCYPNPVRENTAKFRFYAPEKNRMVITVFNAAGEKVDRLTMARDKVIEGNENEVPWDTARFANGLYVCHISFGGHTVRYKVGILK